MTTQNAHYNHHFAHILNFSNGEEIKEKAVSLGHSLAKQLASGDPMVILTYILVLVSVAVMVVSGQFPWFVSMLAVGSVLSLLFPKMRYQRQKH